MSESNASVYSIAIALLILNIITPVFTYALTDFSLEQTFSEELQYLDKEDLIASGIYLDHDERHVLTYEGTPDYVEFTSNLTQAVRVRWWDSGSGGDIIQIYTKIFGEINDWWITARLAKLDVKGEIYQVGLNPKWITNTTLITAWNNNYNWTRVSAPELGLEFFFTCEGYNNSIIDAIDAGILNCTVGRPVNYTEFNAYNFLNWYWGQLSGANYYDMPVYIAWIFRIQAVLLIFSGVIIARDLIGFT